MRVIEPGHVYLLDSYDGGEPQLLTFMKRVGKGYPGNEDPAHSGTNCQETLRAVIDRTRYLLGQSAQETDALSEEEDRDIIFGLRTGFIGFEMRAARRHGRTLVLENNRGSNRGPELRLYCGVCGHIGCEGEHRK